MLSDDWTGRIVSTHAPDIARDLAEHFGTGGPALYPRGTEAEIDAYGTCARRASPPPRRPPERPTPTPRSAARALAGLLRVLGSLEWRLAARDFLLGDSITAADVELWVTLVQLDTVHRWHLDAAAVHRIADHPRLWAYARRLAAHPAFAATSTRTPSPAATTPSAGAWRRPERRSASWTPGVRAPDGVPADAV
ncbi:Glutathione-dependent reductase OS=Streptomyces fumanus OX=67302 GN=GCM10018772_28150 PE=4 SV=1 [Streptomyces fumanus]